MLRLALLVVPFAIATAAAQHGQTQSADPEAPMFVAKASNDAREKISSMQLADGLVADLVAAEPDIANGVAFAIDGKGRFYVCETFRVHDGVFDNRSFMQWLDADLACKTVADRVAKYEKFIPKRVPKLAAFEERVRMLADTDNNGTLDRVTVFCSGFNALEDGLIAGVLPVGNDVITTNIPKVMRFTDRDGDGVADEQHVMFDGFGVHTSLMGHDMHGLIVGPDRRLYWSIGDRGFHVEHEGKQFAYPDEGAVLRCELDGSKLEVVHRGLRNPQELAFDQWGDLITGDNNSDGGDRARIVQILPGGDSGWRIGYQWLSDRGAWNREKLWHPRHPEQTAQIVPPIRNFADGPSGLVYDPGIGLPDRFRDCFFLCDFRGGASYSGIRTFRLSRRGAAFEVLDHDKLAWNVLPTDCDFGPDGSLYFLDWVHGWTKTGKARIYRLRTKEMANDFKLRNNARLLASDLPKLGKVRLQQLLAHADRRVRQRAQFALVDLGAADALAAAAASRASRVARLHGVWGLGILARHGELPVGDLRTFLSDDDSDVRAMAARCVGDVGDGAETPALRELLDDDNSRVRREAAFALARIGAAARPAVAELFELLRHNDDRDHVLRHAAAFALAEVATTEQLAARIDDPSRAVQRGALLALARQRAPEVARFLKHADEQFRYEAARAIYEGPIPAAMQDLALLVYDNTADSERIEWRAINAARMIGEVEQGEAVVHLATQQAYSRRTRLEALAVLAEWRQPDGQCRVTGVWRPCEHPDADIVAKNFRGSSPTLLADAVTSAATSKAIAALGLEELSSTLTEVVGNSTLPAKARVAALDALADLQARELSATLQSIDATAPVALRQRAVALLSHTSPELAVPVLGTLLDNAPIGQRQAACEALGELQHETATALLGTWLHRLERGEVDLALQLDLIEACRKHEALQARTAALTDATDSDDPLASFRMCLEGGDARAGRKVFFDFEATRCTRCHTLKGSGGNAGPVLDDVGARLPPARLLESLIAPSAQIADGFQTTTLELHNGSIYSGIVTRDQDGAVTIVDIAGKPHDIPSDRVKTRKANRDSAMPSMSGSLTRRQLRNLIAFLQKQRTAAGKK